MPSPGQAMPTRGGILRLGMEETQMTTDLHSRDLVIGLTPFTEPNAALAVAVERAGGLGVLDLGRDGPAARAALSRVRLRWGRSFGVRVPAGCALSPEDLPGEVDTVIAGSGVDG